MAMGWKQSVSLTCRSTREDDLVVRLRPFSSEFVETYTRWMQDETLRELTCTPADEMRTVGDVSKVQRELWEDECCLVLIIEVLSSAPKTQDDEEKDAELAIAIGDVSIFQHEWLVDDQAAEVDVMIADPSFRGKGVARVAVLAAMKYFQVVKDVQVFIAKINHSNYPSTRLFKDKLGFQLIADDLTFSQAEYRKTVAELSWNSPETCQTKSEETRLRFMDADHEVFVELEKLPHPT
eukprot:TRINITY_DN420_c0_g1_i2.p1 TRINITY_DN420_c0_g1~~TRINITY_DN420_c0_g1_i2.p1  ORF type:complete len:237 (+),score=64.98 TRINITY_DN420_c0_g1_i2:178-888(+)